MMPPPRRKKWTEAEERTLIDKYGEMVCDGTLPKMKTREKKYKPIALYVNSIHHASDPITYPWQWTWKDVSTKVQNMRHQYSLVKQKIKTTHNSEDFDWLEGITHWSNFLRYKEVFGDVALVCNSNDGMPIGSNNNNNNENGEGFDGSNHRMEIVQFGHFSQEGDGNFAAAVDGVEDGVMGLEFGYDGEEGEENYNGNNNDENNNNNNNNNSNNNHMKEDGDNNGFVYEDIEPVGSDTRKKRKVLKGLEKRAWGFVANQLRQLREMETRFEQRELERERERQRRENLRMENEHEREKRWEKREKEREEREKAKEQLRRHRLQEWEAMEKESEAGETTRREEELLYEREWEERMNQRRCEWKKRIDEMLTQHRVEVGQIQTRILHEQQNLTSQLLGIFPQWTGHPTGIPDHTGASNHYLSQMMQNLHHENGIVHEDTRVEGDNQDDQFIVDG